MHAVVIPLGGRLPRLRIFNDPANSGVSDCGFSLAKHQGSFSDESVRVDSPFARVELGEQLEEDGELALERLFDLEELAPHVPPARLVHWTLQLRVHLIPVDRDPFERLRDRK